MAPPPSTAVPPFVSLIVRIITLACLLVALIILVTANGTASITDYVDVKVRFKDFKAFRYLCAAIVLGLGYTFVQTVITVFQATTGNRLGGDTSLYIDFYGDKILSYVLATGAAASFGMTQDFKNLLDLKELGIHKFINTTNAAASLCLIGFVFAAVSSIFSSLSLPKRA